MPGDAQKGQRKLDWEKKDAKAGAMQKGRHARLIVWWSLEKKKKKTKEKRKEKKEKKTKDRDLGFKHASLQKWKTRPGWIVNYFFLSEESLSSLVHSSPVIF